VPETFDKFTSKTINIRINIPVNIRINIPVVICTNIRVKKYTRKCPRNHAQKTVKPLIFLIFANFINLLLTTLFQSKK